jgi:UPF0755 protein
MFKPNVRASRVEYLHIYSGSDFGQVVDTLKSNGLLIDIESFVKTSKALGYANKVRSGRYGLAPGMGNREIIRMLAAGIQTPVRVTFNNVRTPAQLAQRLSAQLEPDSASIASMFTKPGFAEQMGFTPATLISMFIPNTYELYWNIGVDDLFQRMRREYNKFWTRERDEKAKRLGLSRVEVSILASIVEEETAKREERPRVAGVYINRLRRRIPLQADPTIKFALNDFGLRRVLIRHLDIDSPYNTYKHQGLPPGPINSPSISSIDAVLNHEQHSYLYFCAKDDFSGYHVFAKTLVEHNLNAEAYRRALNRERIYR